jgi:hypothetical protein
MRVRVPSRHIKTGDHAMKLFHLRTDSKKETVVAQTLTEALLLAEISEAELVDCFYAELETYNSKELHKEYCGAV